MTLPATPAADPAATFAARHARRNAVLLAVENALFLIAVAFVNQATVLPLFVTRLGGSAVLVGLAASLQTAGILLPQLVGAGLCAGRSRVMPYLLGPLYAGRPAFLVLAGVILLLGADQPWLLLVAFYLAVAAFFTSDGLASVAWYELIGKAVPARWRGRMWGAAQVVGGLGGIGVGALVGQLLARPELPFPTSYAVVFGLGGLAFCLSMLPYYLVREPPNPAAAEATLGGRPTARQFVAALGPILHDDRNFVRLVVARLLFGVVLATFPFYILFVQRALGELGPGGERVGFFLSAQVLGTLVGGLAVGYVADRLGTRLVVRLAAVVGALVPLLGLATLLGRASLGDALLYLCALIFALTGLVSSASLIGFMNYLLEVAPPAVRSTYTGLYSTLVGAVMLVVPPLAGWFLEATSFVALFAATIAASALYLLVSLGLRRPPPRAA